jgi:Rrf2 family protein
METERIAMNVTTRGRYALRVMLDLAQHGGSGFVSLKTVAERQDISMKYLEAIVCELKKAGLLESGRGKEGGYRLSRAPEDYSVGEILRVLEDNLAPVACIKAGGVDCAHAGECMTLPMWRELDELTNAYLDRVTLQDLLSGEKWRP